MYFMHRSDKKYSRARDMKKKIANGLDQAAAAASKKDTSVTTQLLMIKEIEKDLEQKRKAFEEHEKKKFAQFRLEQNKLLLIQRDELNKKHAMEKAKLEKVIHKLTLQNEKRSRGVFTDVGSEGKD